MATTNVTVDNDGVGLALSATGTGPNLLFVHGVGSAQVMWWPLIERFAPRFRCWNLDLRGHGASDRTPGQYTRSTYQSDVAAALDHITGPTIGIGHSLGGASVARVAAVGHTNLVASYIIDSSLFVPVGGTSTSAPLFERQLAMVTSYQSENRPVADYEATLAEAPYVGGGTIGDAMLPAQLAGRAESLSQMDPGCLQAVLDGYPDAESVEPAFDIPVRVLGADPEMRAAFQPVFDDRLRELTPHIEIERLDGVGHQMMMIRGFDDKVQRDLEDFLSRVIGPPE